MLPRPNLIRTNLAANATLEFVEVYGNGEKSVTSKTSLILGGKTRKKLNEPYLVRRDGRPRVPGVFFLFFPLGLNWF